jgi:CubicO group peptidase (beta-lactamase class C family)
LADGYGLADEAWGIENTARTRFQVASVSKVFTATTALALVEQGKLDLEATVDRYLPELRSDVASKITLQQILDHCAGLKREVFEEGLESLQSHRDDQILAAINTTGLLFEPGTESAYSNVGYVLVRMIIERVTGESFSSVVQRLVFDPAEMEDSGWLKPYEVIPRLASGYDVVLDRVIAAESDDPTNNLGAGGLYTTVLDLAAFDRALREGRVLSFEMQKKRIESRFRGWAMGWKLMIVGEDDDGQPIFATYHNGDASGAGAHFFRFADEGLVIALLSNESDIPRNSLFIAITAILNGDEAPELQPRVADEVYAAVLADGEEAGAELAQKIRAEGRHGVPGAMRAVQVANTLSRAGDEDGARRVYAYAALVDPAAPWGHLGLGQWYEDHGRFDEAEACYREVLARDPDQPHAKAYLEELLNKQDRD